MTDTELLDALNYICNKVDYRTPEEVAIDDTWIKKITQEIIQRRKERQKECQDFRVKP